ncbi:TPR-like protein [Tilletiaria anomala UBC 951]|uniref:TPR-like protein n=1 Tax=Tilletiaria anomala (strain ATCC 24038 / CBS 436.72 / UBC 951) TaxID=1037660 RepID=A0A066VHZ9_TILAU|nr:TPR-like protein [Tilletiaria anomala UBC 951]KDN39933.1 TPR-like protein [Tilletiaria anomala UBC 951]
MTFQSMLSGAECATGSSALNQLLKHTQDDRSLQQDRLQGGIGIAGPSGFRTARNGVPGGSGGGAAEFWQQQQQPASSSGGTFDLGDMKHHMDAMRFSRPPAAGVAVGITPADMNAAFKPPGAQSSMPPLAAAQVSSTATGWHEQFQRHQQHQRLGNPAGGGGGGAPGMEQMAGMHRHTMSSFSSGMGMGMGLGGMTGMYQRPMSSLNQQQEQLQPQVQSSRFVELDDAKWEEQFAKLDAEHQAPATDKGKGKVKAEEKGEEQLSEADQEARIRKALDDLERDVTIDGKEASDRFEELWNSMHSPNADKSSSADADAELAKWEEELLRKNGMGHFGFNHPGGGLGPGVAGLEETGGLSGMEERLMNSFGSVGADGFPKLGEYRLQEQNPFADHANPLAEGLRLLSSGGSLADAALFFEAATQRDVQGGSGGEQGEVDRSRRERSEAWRRLGEAQAMNEREIPAIKALEEAIKIDENNLEAYMSLAISYTNEGYDAAAHATLERYIQRAYPHIKAAPLPDAINGQADPIEGTAGNPWASLNRVTDMFLAAAREGAAKGTIDPEVQVGLGVLFYSNSSYNQAKDCFESALQVRPNDFLLWNRLGATLANGGKPEEAIEAYQKALELRPTFTRAIYNLSVSCLNLGAHHEAAEHLLAALALQQSHALPDVPTGQEPSPTPLSEAQESQNLWSTLRRIFLGMDRMDLAQKAHIGTNLNEFRQSGFEF